jgi:hypothetical protein
MYFTINISLYLSHGRHLCETGMANDLKSQLAQISLNYCALNDLLNSLNMYENEKTTINFPLLHWMASSQSSTFDLQKSYYISSAFR